MKREGFKGATPEHELVPQYVWFQCWKETSAVKCISRVWSRYKRKKLSASILREMGQNDLACAVRRKINLVRGPEYYKQQYRRRLLRSQRGAPVLDVLDVIDSLHQLLRVTAWQYAPVIQNMETSGQSLEQTTRLRKRTLLVASTTMRDAFGRLTRIM